MGCANVRPRRHGSDMSSQRNKRASRGRPRPAWRDIHHRGDIGIEQDFDDLARGVHQAARRVELENHRHGPRLLSPPDTLGHIFHDHGIDHAFDLVYIDHRICANRHGSTPQP